MESFTQEEKVAIRNCEHACTSNCRREGCQCDCGEYHIELDGKEDKEQKVGEALSDIERGN